MAEEIFKEQFASAVAQAFTQLYPELKQSQPECPLFDPRALGDLLERPKDATLGRFALAIFKYLPLLKEPPDRVTSRVSERTNCILSSLPMPPLVKSVDKGGYLNAAIDYVALARQLLPEITASGREYGSSRVGQERTILVEYSSPNIAKPFGVGHLRSTIIGHSLRCIFRKLGYHAIGINYPGDWGTQFGKMIVAFGRWGNRELLHGNAVKHLLDLYVRFHTEAEQDASLDKEARQAFKQLEDGEPTAVALWEEFKKISHAEFDRIYGILGVDFDLVIGESFFNDKMDGTIERLKRNGLTSISQGALVVDLGDPQLPPALLRKADGATLYITRDLAGLIYRWETYHFHESLYVVGASQADHFRQALKVIEKMETAETLPPEQRMTGRVKHIGFGWVKFGEKTMSTRRGNIVFLEDVIDEAVRLVKQKIKQKNSDLPDIDGTSTLIGVGAVIFSQLCVRRQKDVTFVWEEVLNFEGETGPYLQYTHARLCSLLRLGKRPVSSNIDFALLEGEEERRVLELLSDFPEAIADAASEYDPAGLASYLLRLAGAFNKFYQRKDTAGRIDKIISDDIRLTDARLLLVASVKTVIGEGLYLLGIRAPEEM